MKSHDIRVAIYARVSSEQQAKENTIGSQLEALQERVASDGCSLEEELRFVDEGYSGASLARPALERLRDAAYAGGFDRLYVHSPDRLARKYAYQILLVEELRRCGVELVFLNRTIGDSPEEDLLLQMQGMISEYERAKILERSRRGKRHAARRGLVSVLCGAPYGYRYVSKRDAGGEAFYQVVLEHAQVVRQIFEWVGRDRVSLREVCRRLENQKIPSPRGKTWWDRTTIWGILKNPAYKGEAAFGKTRIGERRVRLRPQRNQSEPPRRTYSIYDTPLEERVSIPVPPLVSEELFEAVREQLVENQKGNRQRKRGAKHLLQGLVVCDCCGYAYYGKPVSRASAKGKVPYTYYRCVGSDAYRFGGHRVCHNKQVRTDGLDAAVWADVSALLRNPEAVRQEYERRLTEPQGQEDDRNQLERQIRSARRGISRLIDAYEEGVLTKAEFLPRIDKARERLKRLENETAEIERRKSEEEQIRLVIGQLDDFAKQVQHGLESADWTTRREIIRALVKSVKIGTDQVRITYRINALPFADGPRGGHFLQHCWRSDLSLAGQPVPALVRASVPSTRRPRHVGEGPPGAVRG